MSTVFVFLRGNKRKKSAITITEFKNRTPGKVKRTKELLMLFHLACHKR